MNVSTGRALPDMLAGNLLAGRKGWAAFPFVAIAIKLQRFFTPHTPFPVPCALGLECNRETAPCPQTR